MGERATSPVVGKAMEATIVVLYVGLVTSTLYAGVVPEYRTEAGTEVAERTASSAALDVERSIPPETTRAEVGVDVDLPATIAGEEYRIYADGDRLVLEHPDPAVATEVPLVLPDRVVAVTGTWHSGDSTRVRVVTVEAGLEVSLE